MYARLDQERTVLVDQWPYFPRHDGTPMEGIFTHLSAGLSTGVFVCFYYS
jgi:hypothetical protein